MLKEHLELPKQLNHQNMNYKLTLCCMIGFLITSCSFSQNKELFITANTNICTNCFGEYQLFNAFDEQIDLRLVFRNNDKKSASKFADKFFHIGRPFEIICNDSLYNQLSHNTIPWVYYYENNQLVFESALTEIEFWTPYINGDKISQKISKLPDNIILSEKIRFMPYQEGFVIADFSYNEIHFFDGKWNFIWTQDFSNLNMEGFYQAGVRDIAPKPVPAAVFVYLVLVYADGDVLADVQELIVSALVDVLLGERSLRIGLAQPLHAFLAVPRILLRP